jgi:hypothetical protein
MVRRTTAREAKGRVTDLRKCIRPFCGGGSPGHDEMRCVLFVIRPFAGAGCEYGVGNYSFVLACSFENYLSYSALARTDDEAVAGGFNDRSRDDMKVIHAENSLDLSEEPRQKPEISADHPNEASYHFRNELLVRGGQR